MEKRIARRSKTNENNTLHSDGGTTFSMSLVNLNQTAHTKDADSEPMTANLREIVQFTLICSDRCHYIYMLLNFTKLNMHISLLKPISTEVRQCTAIDKTLRRLMPPVTFLSWWWSQAFSTRFTTEWVHYIKKRSQRNECHWLLQFADESWIHIPEVKPLPTSVSQVLIWRYYSSSTKRPYPPLPLCPPSLQWLWVAATTPLVNTCRPETPSSQA